MSQLRFSPVDGLTLRGDFEGGVLSSDFGAVPLRGVDCQDRPERAPDHSVQRASPTRLIDHPLAALFSQRI